MIYQVFITLLFSIMALTSKTTPSNPSASQADYQVRVHNITVDDGIQVFYREAGNPSNPTILLLHGDPSSSHQFRHLIPLLSPKYHVLAPDYPGFGFTNVPASRNYKYSFANITNTISQFIDALNQKSYVLYIFDYGAPVGLRLAVQDPSRVLAIVSQNGNTYTDGLGAAFNATVAAYYNDPSNKTLEAGLREFLTLPGIKNTYSIGMPDPSVIEPESYTLDAALTAVPGNQDIKLELFRDYKTNKEMYPTFQAYLRKYQPPLLAIWGGNDPFFVPAGAEAFKRDVPNAVVKFVDSGHFALENNLLRIAEAMLEFLSEKGIEPRG